MNRCIWHVTDYFAPKVGGMERSIEYLIRALADRFAIEVLTPKSPDAAIPDPALAVRRFEPHPGGWYEGVLGYLRRLQPGPGIVHVFGFSYRWPDAQARFLAWVREELGARLVLKVPTLGDADRYLEGPFRSIVPLVDRFLALTPALAEELLGCGVAPGQIFQVPNGVPVDCFRPVGAQEKARLRERLGLPHDRFLVGFAGRFVGRKRIDLLVEGIRRLPVQRRPLLLLIGYVDPEFADGTAMEHWLGPDVRWIPTQNDMRPVYPALDLYASASEAEGMSNAILEAMACGVPVLASDVPGHRELVVPGETGWLFPTGDVPAFADFLEAAVEEAKEGKLSARGMHGRDNILRGYDIRLVADRYAALYEDLLARGESR